MEVSVRKVPAFKALVCEAEGHFEELGQKVRKAWRTVGSHLAEYARGEEEAGYVFIPQWEAPSSSVLRLKVGVHLPENREIPDAGDLEVLSVPERTYAVVTCRGGREEMMNLYGRLEEWIGGSGYEPDNEEGVYSFEVNPLKPVNPFDIPADAIDAFHFDIYRAVRLRHQP
ncbi:GyrI-like domain-containing protein [Paenibacillus chitinolyticus]|uniref:GyrI-like domain-containing protein n=1 Tax=Paenibacillus chitinolyticus TaxID=79263 RepID=UPI002DB74ADC|nr:GyrI-like domain-containing protein [Paenibacillus chitinolyticus]MEC0245466.1 GyrI-like domain-containing protein [Paenibacillus chitinolyticus]